MENLEKYKIVIYILLALLYFIFKGRKKKPASAGTDQMPENRRNAPSTKPIRETKPLIQANDNKDSEKFEGPVSLEDLLKGLNKKQEEPTKSIFAEKSKKVKYKDIVQDDGEAIAEKSRVEIDAEIKKAAEEKEFTPYTTQQTNSNEYAYMLNDPEKLKKVFVAQEIFNPKHF